MSNITGSMNVHSFAALDKNSEAASGQRLVRLIAKGENKHPNLSQSLCVSVPRVTQDMVADVIDKLLPHVVGMVQDAQDKIIREFRIEHGRDEIPEEAFNMATVIEWLDANAAGDRVSSEYLAQWFSDEYKTEAMAYIANAMNADCVNGTYPEAVEQKFNILRDMFAGWSSNKYSPNIPKLRAMIKFGEFLRNTDVRMDSLLNRAKAMLAKKEAELQADSLGF